MWWAKQTQINEKDPEGEAGHVFGMSWVEIMIILAVGMFVLGPERIPVAVKWVGSTLKTVRTMAAGAQEQLRGEFGPELDELRRQVEELQGLKEIQELRKLRDLNPRSLITKNLLGEELTNSFSGGVGGFLGLNQGKDVPVPTGSGVAPAPPSAPAAGLPINEPPTVEPPPTVDMRKPAAVGTDSPVGPESPVATRATLAPTGPAPGATPPAVSINEPGVSLPDEPIPTAASTPRHAAAAAFDLDAT